MKEGEHLKDLDVGGRIILKCIFLERFVVLTTVLRRVEFSGMLDCFAWSIPTYRRNVILLSSESGGPRQVAVPENVGILYR